jgi:hypothetical protein
MRLPVLSRRKLTLAGVLVSTVLVVVAAAFGPVVRGQVATEAARRGLEVQVGSVRPGWFAVRLLDVVVHPHDVSGIEARITEVRASLSAGLTLRAIDLHGGEIRITGDADLFREQLRAWREQRGSSAGGSRSTLPISADSFDLVWREGDVPRAEAHGLGFLRDEHGLRVAAADLHVRSPGSARESLDLGDAAVDLDAQGDLVRAHASSALIAWAGPSSMPADTPPSEAARPEPSPPAKPADVQVVAVRATPAKPRSQPPPIVAPSEPLLPLPDLHGLRSKAASLAALLALRVPEGAEASVDAMTWRIGEDGDRRSVTIGPGPALLTRTPSRFEARFSTDTHASSTTLSVRLLLPTDAGDVSATLEGGPVSLSLLGIKEGAAGLVEVDRATVTGQARVTLSGDASALTVDAEIGTRGLSLHQPRLALDVVRGIDVDLRVRGALSDAGELRVDDFAATWGAAHLAASGVLDEKPDHVSASFRFELPSEACQSLLESVPTALLPALQGTKMTGTFGARGRFSFDTRALDDLELEYDVQDQCRVTEVPSTLARERFKQPFAHRIYLPDGSTAEQKTGPGTPNWTPIGSISPYMQVAVLTTEDGGFPHHRGFNRSAIRASIVANLAARRFVRGASTITMQLAKNLFLARDKTLARKLQEVVLTDYLEQTFSKDELMELYLNVIEFGPAVYGVTAAAEYYFGRSPADLNLAESLFLSSLLPAPLRYGGMRDADQVPDGWMRSIRNLMRIENKRGLITEDELAEGQAEVISFWHGGQRPVPRPPAHLRSRLGGDDSDVPPDFDSPPDTP